MLRFFLLITGKIAKVFYSVYYIMRGAVRQMGIPTVCNSKMSLDSAAFSYIIYP